MTKQVRDWQEDKNELDLFMDGWFPGGASNTRDAVLAFFYFAKEALPYYRQQYAAKKKRADKLEERNKALIAAVTADTNGTFRCVEEARSEAAETREKKLREALETAAQAKYNSESYSNGVPWTDISAVRKPQFDQYAEDGIIPKSAYIADGWYFECDVCGSFSATNEVEGKVLCDSCYEEVKGEENA